MSSSSGQTAARVYPKLRLSGTVPALLALLPLAYLVRMCVVHFVDVPFSPDGTPLPEIPTPNAQTRINDFRAVLASNSPDALKSYDLSWLLHLVGDIHQPLHGTTRVTHSRPGGDDGGNGLGVVGRIT